MESRHLHGLDITIEYRRQTSTVAETGKGEAMALQSRPNPLVSRISLRPLLDHLADDLAAG